MNLLNGNVKMPNGIKLPILWTGENALHLMVRMMENPSLHPYNHVQAQKNLQKSNSIVNLHRNKYIGLCFHIGSYTTSVFIKHPNFAEIKTSTFTNQDSKIAKRRYNISGLKTEYNWDKDFITEIATVLELDEDLIKKKLIVAFTKYEKQKKSKKKK